MLYNWRQAPTRFCTALWNVTCFCTGTWVAIRLPPQIGNQLGSGKKCFLFFKRLSIIVRLLSRMIQRKMCTLWLSSASLLPDLPLSLNWELAMRSFPQTSSQCKMHKEWVWSSQVLIALCKGLHQVISGQNLKSFVYH